MAYFIKNATLPKANRGLLYSNPAMTQLITAGTGFTNIGSSLYLKIASGYIIDPDTYDNVQLHLISVNNSNITKLEKFTVDPDGKSAKIEFGNGDPTTDWNIDIVEFHIISEPVAPGWELKASELADLNSNHVTLYANNVEVTAPQTFPMGTVFKATVASGYIFDDTGNRGKSYGLDIAIIKAGMSDWDNFMPEDDQYSLFYTLDASTTYATSGQLQVFVKADANPPVPLEWVTAPTTGESNTPIAFSWKGGDVSTTKYNLVVLESDGTTITDDQNIDVTSGVASTYTANINEAAGTYTVLVYDKNGRLDPTAAHIEKQIVLSDVVPVFDYTLSQSDYDALRTAHINLSVDGTAAHGGSQWNYGAKLTATVEADYIFFDDVNGTSIYFNSTTGRKNFVLSTDKKTATFDFVAISGGSYSGLVGATNNQTNPTTDTTNNIYVVDNDIMEQVSKARFKLWVNPSDGSTNVVDYGEWILGLVRFPFAIDPALIPTKRPIILGQLDTQIAADSLNTDTINIYLGKIHVPAVLNNALDYFETKALLHIPFNNPVDIDLNYVIDCDISINYVIDVYNAKATILIKSSAINNDVVNMITVDTGFKVPYADYANNKVDNINIDLTGDNEVRTPYIEIVKRGVVLPNGQFSIPIVDEDILANQKGYVVVDQIILNTTALKNEKDDIMSFLNRGVIIK